MVRFCYRKRKLAESARKRSASSCYASLTRSFRSLAVGDEDRAAFFEVYLICHISDLTIFG